MTWFRKSSTDSSRASLAERVLDSGCRRVAILGLHPGAGAATTLSAVATGLRRLDATPGVTSAAGGARDDDPSAWPGERTRLPADVVAATVRGTLAEAGAKVVPLDEDAGSADVAIVRVVEEGPIVLHGPEDGDRMAAVLERLDRVVPGPVCLTGRWDRRSFASPGRVDGWILAVGAALSPDPERVAAAVRHHVELTALRECDGPDRLAWEVATSRGEVAIVGESGALHDTVPVGSPEIVATVRRIGPSRVRGIIHPGIVRDELAKELVREDWRGVLVVRDPTRIHIAPVYYRAWTKAGGEVRVIRAAHLVAVAANPVSPVGEDADASEFRDRIAEALVDVPVHDVVLEDPESSTRPGWRLWSR